MEKLINKLAVTKLKDLIKAIRSSKTMAEERAVIAKESALIRTAIKDELVETRFFNLLYIHMLGYAAHFGQIECLKLAASPRYSDKKLGYLGIMLLLDESQETLTLVTNCLQNDMNSQNVFISALALGTLGNIASPEMARDLCGDVEKLLGSSNAYIRKKAALCAIRIIKKVPDLIENFIEKAKLMVAEKTDSSLLTGIALEIEMCKLNPEYSIPQLKEQVPVLVRHLKNRISTGFSPEHDVSGVTDPFLQIKILRLLRYLGASDPRTSELMNDVLAQVATTTESSKNVGNAILYEVVLTIHGIEAEHAVKVLAINILGKFLGNGDNNIRYVALTTLTTLFHMSPLLSSQDSTTSLQRHRQTILACLRDADSTLRAKALDLAFLLITPNTITPLLHELLTYLKVNVDIGGDARVGLGKKIVDAAARYRVSKVWEVLVNMRVLMLCGDALDNGVVEVLVHHFVKILSVLSEDVQVMVARRLLKSVRNGGGAVGSKVGVVVAMAWVVGEVGDLVVDGSVKGVTVQEGEDVGVEDGGDVVLVDAGSGDGGLVGEDVPSEKEVVDVLEGVLKGHFAGGVVDLYCVMALMKLTARFGDEAVLSRINKLISEYQKSIDVEIQARAVEFAAIANLDVETKAGLLERMPVLDIALKEEEVKGTGQNLVSQSMRNSTEILTQSKQSAPVSAIHDLLDLNFDIAPSSNQPPAAMASNLFGDLPLTSQGTSAHYYDPTNIAATKQTPAVVNTDLLSDLFAATTQGSSTLPPNRLQSLSVQQTSSSISTPTYYSAAQSPNLQESLTPSMSSSLTINRPKLKAFSKSGLEIYLSPTRSADNTVVDVLVTFENVAEGVAAVSGLSYQVAVPKSLRLSMGAPSGDFIPPGGVATQSMRIENPGKGIVKLRLKIAYMVGNESVNEMTEFGGL